MINCKVNNMEGMTAYMICLGVIIGILGLFLASLYAYDCYSYYKAKRENDIENQKREAAELRRIKRDNWRKTENSKNALRDNHDRQG